MSIGVGDRAGAYAIHVFMGAISAYSACLVAKKVKNFISPNKISKVTLVLLGGLTGVALSALITRSPGTHKRIVRIAWSCLFGWQSANAGRDTLHALGDRISPLLGNRSCIFSGAVGALIGSWASLADDS